MSENVDYRILEHLKAIRGDLETVKDDLRDIKTRLLTMGSYQAATHIDAARQTVRLDELDHRLSRVEVRINLAE